MRRSASSLATLCCALAVAGALTGCSSTTAGGQVELAVVDLSLRSPGVECAGTDPLSYLHAGATYRITDASERTLVRGTLPAGVAEPAYDTDFGNAVRIPTVCAMTLTLDQVPGADAHWLVVDGGKPIALRGTDTAGGWTARVPEAAAEWTPSAEPTMSAAGSSAPGGGS